MADPNPATAAADPQPTQKPRETPAEYLHRLQDESDRGYHRDLRAWVDDHSSVARVLNAYADQVAG